MIGSVTTLGLSGVSIGDLYGWGGSGVIIITAFVPPQYRIDTNTLQIIARDDIEALKGSDIEAIERA